MSDDLVNQLTLNFLISKQQLQKLNKKGKELASERKNRETKEYSDRIKTLFSDLLVCNPPDDLLYEVKMAFDTFVEKSIYYFKAHDNTDNLEQERTQIIHEDIDYDKEEREIEKGNYKERTNDIEDIEELEDNELEDGYNEDSEDEEEEDYNKISNKLTTDKTINHSPIVVQSKYRNQTNSIGVEDIQKLPLDWFENVRQNYKKNQILPRKKESTIIEPTFREIKKKI